MSAPTPGPWTAGLDAVFAAGHQIVIASTWGVGGPGDRQEAIANARLIAAAPDMLAALKQLVADYEDVPDPTDADGQEVFTAAREAIAKAEGA